MGNINMASGGASFTVSSVPIGGIATVFASGDAYKATGTTIQRSLYPEMSTAFPRKGAYAFSLVPQPTTGSSSLAKCGAFGNGIFVILMTSGSTNMSADSLFSADGVTWTATTMSLTMTWTAICFGGPGAGLFVAVGNSSGGSTNQCCTSPDGVNWTTRTMSTAVGWQSIAWYPAAGLFVALSGGGLASTSPDGITWTTRTIPTATVLQIAVSPTCIVAVTANGAVIRSVDAITWTTIATPKSGMSIAYGLGLFVVGVTGSVAAGIMTSPDGITWTVRTTPTSYGGGVMIYADGLFLSVSSGSNTAVVSFDGITWLQKSSGMVNAPVFGVFGNGAYLIAAPFVSSGTTYHQIVYTENLINSDWMYIGGTSGQYVRVR